MKRAVADPPEVRVKSMRVHDLVTAYRDHEQRQLVQWYRLGRQSLQAGNYEEALAWLKKIDDRPDLSGFDWEFKFDDKKVNLFSVAYTALSEAYVRPGGRLKNEGKELEADVFIQKAKDARHSSELVLHEVRLIKEGQGLLSLNHNIEAQKRFSEAIEINPLSNLARCGLVEARFKKGGTLEELLAAVSELDNILRDKTHNGKLSVEAHELRIIFQQTIADRLESTMDVVRRMSGGEELVETAETYRKRVDTNSQTLQKLVAQKLEEHIDVREEPR